MLKNYFLAIVPMFVAIDAIGMLPIYMSLTRGLNNYQKTRLVQRSILTALGVALAFLFVGRWVFWVLGITISDFLVAGGAILFILSIRDMASFSKSSKITDEALGIVPLAVPLIVGPAVLTTSLILLNAYGIYVTFFSIVFNIMFCGVVLTFANRLSKLIGEAGSMTLSKIFSLLLGAIGVMLMRRGLQDIFVHLK